MGASEMPMDAPMRGMMRIGARLGRRGFTLVELLVVVAIIGVLASLIVSGLARSRREAMKAATLTQLRGLATALKAYDGAAGLLPRDPASAPGRDVSEFLFAGLHNAATRELGGAPGGPFFDPEAAGIGLLLRSAGSAGPWRSAAPLEGEVHSSAEFQRAHGPLTEAPAVFVDAWGNAIHYREWRSKREDVREAMARPAPAGLGADAMAGWELWSDGPDGVDDGGAPGSDDLRLSGG